MKKNLILRVIILIAAVPAVLASCQKFQKAGSRINFSASIINGARTKTVYGDLNGAGNQQDIKWAAGDQISIYSSNTAIASTSSNQNNAAYGLSIKASDNTSATLNGSDALIWNSEGDVDFYGVYPYDVVPLSTVGQFSMEIPVNQSSNFGETSIVPGYMVAKTPYTAGTSEVSIDFYPVFSAFEVHLKNSESSEITLKKFAIKTDNSSYNLAGEFTADWTTASSTGEGASYTITNGLGQEVYIELPDGTTISDTEEQVLTLYLTPFEYSGLYLEVTFIREGETAESVRKLQLKNNDSFITFAPRNKFIINGLALDGGEIWILNLSGNVEPWNGESRTIEQSVSISGKVRIQNAIETTDAWKNNNGGKANHYFDTYWSEQGSAGYGVTDSSHPDNYDKNYQIRTLNRDLPPSQRYFVMTFTPTAPVGGYWQLIPQYREGDTQSPLHFRFERSLPSGGKSEELLGQILTTQETIKIYPVDWDPSDVNTYSVWFTCVFSTSPSFTSSINADSEFQDVHSDGRFSYWVFRLQQYEGQYE